MLHSLKNDVSLFLCHPALLSLWLKKSFHVEIKWQQEEPIALRDC